MTLVDRPNRQALIDALDIYRDEMRSFIVRNLKRVPGRKVEDCIKFALHDTQYNQFVESRSEDRSVEASIDINAFPQIVKTYWRDAFGDRFKTGGNVQAAMYSIIEVRNNVSHPGTDDVGLNYAVDFLKRIATLLTEINQSDQADVVNAIRVGLLPFKTHAHKFRQGGRDVYAFSLDLETLDKLLPDRVDDKMVIDANRPLTASHAKDIQMYLEDRSDWLLGALLLGVPSSNVDFQTYTPDSNAENCVGSLIIDADGAAAMKMFDGQHRRRAIKDVINGLARNTSNSNKLASLKENSIPIMLYVEDDIDALRQMFADAAQTRSIEGNTVTRFDQRDAFNLAALWIADYSDLFVGRVEMERTSVARSSHNIIAINQLAQTLKTLEVGYSGRISKDRNEVYMQDLDSLYERCLTWADDFMPSARDEYNDLMAGEIDNSDIPGERVKTMAYNAIVIRIFAACYYKWTNGGYKLPALSDWSRLADFLRNASLRPGIKTGSLLIDAGVVPPGGTSPIAQRQTVVQAIDYIIEQAREILA